jgi:YfiH family protein
MPFQSQKDIRFFTFSKLGPGVKNAIFTRRGGVSPEPWETLNMGSSVGDDQKRVNENKRLALESLELEPFSVYDVYQVHGVEVVIAESPRPPELPHLRADAILTDKIGVTLMMRFADCLPIMLSDPVRRVVGIIHAGWKGTLHGVTRVTVKTMKNRFGSNPADIHAAIGPSIGPDHYEVGPDVVDLIRKSFGYTASSLLSFRKERAKFDMWTANVRLLEEVGVHQVEVSGLCTACGTEDWYSHRAEKGRTGRFGAIIALV